MGDNIVPFPLPCVRSGDKGEPPTVFGLEQGAYVYRYLILGLTEYGIERLVLRCASVKAGTPPESAWQTDVEIFTRFEGEVRPRYWRNFGGGYFSVTDRVITIAGISRYGKEPNRKRTRELLRQAFPGRQVRVNDERE